MPPRMLKFVSVGKAMVRINEGEIVEKGRVGPGQMIAIDLAQGKLYHHPEIMDHLAAQADFGAWVKNITVIDTLIRSKPGKPASFEKDELRRRQVAVGLTQEDLELILHPMVEDAKEAIGSMDAGGVEAGGQPSGQSGSPEVADADALHVVGAHRRQQLVPVRHRILPDGAAGDRHIAAFAVDRDKAGVELGSQALAIVFRGEDIVDAAGHMMGPQVDYTRFPAEDFARGTIVLRGADGREAIIEATTSWAYVGPGLRIQLELLGPEYSMEFSSLNAGLKIFLSRAISGGQGEDLVEKQNAEQGWMPVVEDETGTYGLTAENRHMVECFRAGKRPMETFDDGVAVMELLMALYRSAEIGQVVKLPAAELETYVPPVARGE